MVGRYSAKIVEGIMIVRAAICVIIQDEVHDIAEWILHHLGVGFAAVFAYDNESNDGTTHLLRRLAQVLPVTHIPWPSSRSISPQTAAYQHCMSICAGRYDWVAAIDADEFLICEINEPITALLHRMETCSHIAINWLIFGSSGLRDTNGKLVLESFTRRAPVDFGPNAHVKSIVRPQSVLRCVNAHTFESPFPVVDVEGKIITEWFFPGLMRYERITLGQWRLHHYLTRSRSHWDRRRLRRGGDIINPHRSEADFISYDRSEELDTTALHYVPAIKEAMRILGMSTTEIAEA